MNHTLRYVTRRAGKNGKARWYWQRRGYPLTRLPDNLVKRVALVEKLNAHADTLKLLRPSPTGEPLPGSIAWIISRYRKSEEYAKLAPRTAGHYERILKEIERLRTSLNIPFNEAWTRRAVVDFIEAQPKYDRRLTASVLKNLFKLARYYGFVETDHTTDLRLPSPKPRDRIWSDDEVARWLMIAVAEDPDVATAFILLIHTAQRPGDVLRMSWADYQPGMPGHIRVRQEKTRALLDVPVHSDLAAHLDALPRRPGPIFPPPRGSRAVSYRWFSQRFARISKRLGIDAQPRDLRRTAMMNLAIAGATVPEIASVSGHSIDATQRILETYLPRNTKLAEAAIARLPIRSKKEQKV